MKAVILAGGLGSRLMEETQVRPKPMIEIGGKPILWHIMKIYSAFGINEFVICLGYKGYLIKEYFSNYLLHTSDVTFDFRHNSTEFYASRLEPWRVTLVDTGEHTMTGGRLGRVKQHVGNTTFCMTYGDGVSDIDISQLLKWHHDQGRQATVTAVQPPGRFGSLQIEGSGVNSFIEKPQGDGGWINAGFFVLEPSVFDLIEGDSCIWEQKPLNTLAHRGELTAYKHTGFWQAMDTLRDYQQLEGLWQTDQAPWRTW